MKLPEQLGPYRIEGVLGKGGMGRVYRAVHNETDDSVAIKALSPQLALNDGFIERFRAEIESLRLLRHAGIVRLFGYGQEGETLFYAMELVDGPSLEDEVRNGRRFTWREVTDIGVQVSRALKHAHDHGVIHRDIKPANILLSPSGKVKLADFGIARLFGGSNLTVAGGVIGTADYMAPEQVAGEAVTTRCDQYSLGGVMFTLLAGRPPFMAKTLPEMLQLQRYAEPELVRRFAPDTPAQLEQAIAQMLSKSPDERFPNTLVLAKHLEAMLIALSRPPQPDEATQPDNGEQSETPPAAPKVVGGTHGVTRGYDSQTELLGSESGESIVIVDDYDEDATPSASALVTGRAVQGAETIAAGDVAEPREKRPPASLFMEVQQEKPTDAMPAWQLAAQGAVVIGLLFGGVWGAYRYFAPRDADTLHAAIEQTLAPGDASAHRAAAEDVAEFLSRFPNDPRSAELQGVQETIDTARLERQLSAKLLASRLRTRLRGGETGSPPIEQLYLDAMQQSKTNPDRAIQELTALATLIDATDGADEINHGFANLARRQAERLREAAVAEEATHRPFIKEQLERIRALADSDPEESTRLMNALRALYDEQPWATDLLRVSESD